MGQKRVSSPYDDMSAFDEETGNVHAFIETPKGSRNKFEYDPEKGVFRLDKVLPAGAVFPFDFGYIPSTLGADGDPVDLLVLMDEPAFPGCLVLSRLIGVIEAEQSSQGKTVRNDRLIAIAVHSYDHQNIHELAQVNENLVNEIAHFFISYDEMEGKQFKPIGRGDSQKALELVKQGEQLRQQKKS